MTHDQLKIAIVSGASKKNDSVRGIGAHNSELFKAFNKLKDNNYDTPEVNVNDDLSKFDIVHFTVFRPFFTSLPYTKPKGTKFILTIHDLVPLIYPKIYKPGIKGKLKFLINKYLIRKNIDQIITISETSKKDICRFLEVDPNIVKVIYLAPKEAHHPLKKGSWAKEIKSKYNLPEKFAFYLGDINYNKNIPTLVKACEKAKLKLVIAGKHALEIDNYNLKSDMALGPMDYLRSLLGDSHPETAHYKDLSKAFKSNNIVRVGFVSDEEANQMMNLAICTIQPSYYEGFGLSVIHAFASGCPVIASKTQALVEIGGDACLYFDPYDVEDLVNKIKSFNKSESLRKEYIKKGLEQIKKFSWKKTADQTLDVYENSI